MASLPASLLSNLAGSHDWLSRMAGKAGARRWRRWVIGGVVAVVALVVGVPYVYIHFIEGNAPAALSLGPAASVGTQLSANDLDGTWKVGPGSVAGYRVKEVLAGQNNTAVGRGSGVSGTLTIKGTSVTAGQFTVDLRTVKSDSGQRDSQFNGRIMDTAQFPNAVFTLTSPITLTTLPKVNQTLHVQAKGTLAMHGVTKPVTVTLAVRDSGSAIAITGTIPVVFANWNIANPSFSGFVKTENNGVVEFDLKTSKS
jgi:polyisoprenoid-binding protein YceI